MHRAAYRASGCACPYHDSGRIRRRWGTGGIRELHVPPLVGDELALPDHPKRLDCLSQRFDTSGSIGERLVPGGVLRGVVSRADAQLKATSTDDREHGALLSQHPCGVVESANHHRHEVDAVRGHCQGTQGRPTADQRPLRSLGVVVVPEPHGLEAALVGEPCGCEHGLPATCRAQRHSNLHGKTSRNSTPQAGGYGSRRTVQVQRSEGAMLQSLGN